MAENVQPLKRRLRDKLQETPSTELLNFDDHSEEHIDEKWLISYADLMTLLFGLFVMLYTIAMETQGRPDKVLSDIVAGRNSLEEMQKLVSEKDTKLQELSKETVTLNTQLSEKSNQIKITTDELAQFKLTVEQLNSKIQSLQEQSEQKPPVENTKELVGEMSSLKTTLDKQTKKSLGLAAEVERLKKENQGLKSDIKTNNFMIVVLNWMTPQHDIDLRVTDPSGRKFDFQNRTLNESPAKFVVDSRTGPGVEMWETPQIEKGEYEVEFSFYNTYGNKDPAIMTGSVITKKGVFEFPNVSLDFAGQKKKRFKIRIVESGVVTILPL